MSNFDTELLDKFVDGELDEAGQRALLARMDDEPDGWRRLALAFVENQAWRENLSAAPISVTPARPSHRERANRNPSWLSIALSVLVALGVGLSAGRVWQSKFSGSPNETLPRGTIAKNGETNRANDRVPSVIQGNPQVGLVSFTLDGTPIQLPVYDSATAGPATLAKSSSTIPREALRALRNTGHEVKRQNHLWPIELADGRQIVVPVEQLDIQYVGHQAFQ